jgi:hypothetical protein
MNLTLDRLDLSQEHIHIACSKTRFEHFSAEAQVAIKAVGRAQFREFDGSNYNAIYPPPTVCTICGRSYLERRMNPFGGYDYIHTSTSSFRDVCTQASAQARAQIEGFEGE